MLFHRSQARRCKCVECRYNQSVTIRQKPESVCRLGNPIVTHASFDCHQERFRKFGHRAVQVELQHLLAVPCGRTCKNRPSSPAPAEPFQRSGSYLEHQSALRKGPSVSHLRKSLPCREWDLKVIRRPAGSFWQTFMPHHRENRTAHFTVKGAGQAPSRQRLQVLNFNVATQARGVRKL